MNAALARLQNERCMLLRQMLCSNWRGFCFAGHPWAEQARNLHNESKCIREHHSK